jgi:transcriptional regulator with XRE-family HTH domain
MNISVSERIVLILKHFNLNQKKLAKLAGIPENTLSNAKKGKNIPNLEFFNAIYKAFPNLNLLWLYHGEGSMLTDNIMTEKNSSSLQSDPNSNNMEFMLKKIAYLQEQIYDKEEIINLLKSNNTKYGYL